MCIDHYLDINQELMFAFMIQVIRCKLYLKLFESYQAYLDRFELFLKLHRYQDLYHLEQIVLVNHS